MPPQQNATVTNVTGVGTVDDWDQPLGPVNEGLEKWVGEARAYYRERAVRRREGDSVNVVVERELILDVAEVLAMELDTDDVITFLVDGRPDPYTGTAKTIPTPTLAGVPRSLVTSRIMLEDL